MVFKAFKILTLSNFKEQSDSKLIMFIDLLTPLAYSTIFCIQILLFYRVNPNAFAQLSKPLFYISLFASQMIVFLTPDRCLRILTDEILDSRLDIILMRPINFFFYKYMRFVSPQQVIMLSLFMVGIISSSIIGDVSFSMFLKVMFFVLCATIIKANLISILYSNAFFTRDVKQVNKIRTLEELPQNKPVEVFPAPIKFLLIYMIPYMVIQSFIFDLVRGFDSTKFWLIVFSWIIVSAILNKILWIYGLRRYESM